MNISRFVMLALLCDCGVVMLVIFGDWSLSW